MIKKYDCFLFFNELDLLEMRLNILNDAVDYFVLVESSMTHQGNPKNYIFEENKKRYEAFLHKIIHIKVDDTPQNFNIIPQTFKNSIIEDIYTHINKTHLFDTANPNHNSYGRDFFQKECIKLGLYDCKDDDIIIFSDLDEIPNPEILHRINEFFNPNEFYTFKQVHYAFFLNMLNYTSNYMQNDEPAINKYWKGTLMSSYGNIKNKSLNELRATYNTIIYDGGWHFSYMGGIHAVIKKIQSYSHSENNNEFIIKNFEKFIEKNVSILHNGRLEKTNMDDGYPEYIIKNIEKYKHLIKD